MCANMESSLLTANTYWFSNNKQRTTWPTTFCSYSETGEQEWQDGGIVSLFFFPHKKKASIWFIFAISDFQLKTAKRFPSLPSGIPSLPTSYTTLFHFPRSNLSRHGKLVFYKYFQVWMTWNSFLCKTTFKIV